MNEDRKMLYFYYDHKSFEFSVMEDCRNPHYQKGMFSCLEGCINSHCALFHVDDIFWCSLIQLI